MVKMGLDTYEEPINQSALNGGWTPQGYVTGISLMHESGTGGGAKYVRDDLPILCSVLLRLHILNTGAVKC